MTAAKNPLDRLPELPLEEFESIGPLELSAHGPFLTIKPPRVEAFAPPPPPENESKKSSHKVQLHYAWVTYPVVVCHHPGPFADDLQIADRSPGGPRLRSLDDEFRDAGRVEHYRLSALDGRTLPNPLWCTVAYGPYLGFFREQESCTEDDYTSQWEFFVYGGVQGGVQGVPGDDPDDEYTYLVYASWIGVNTDLPAVPNLEVIWTTFASKPARTPPCGSTGFPKDTKWIA